MTAFDRRVISREGIRKAQIAVRRAHRRCTHLGNVRIECRDQLAFDAQMAERHAELYLYIRQRHAERDLAAIPRWRIPC
jgi:hypothetical protein